MAQTTVFVDDAVLGRLPSICAKTGLPTNDRLVLRVPVGTASNRALFWLLVLGGPLGWLVYFLFIAGRDVTERVTVQVPMTEAAHDAFQAGRRRQWWAGLFAVVATALAVGAGVGGGSLAPGLAVLAVAAVVGGLVAILAAADARDRLAVDVEIDGSRRWVTLRQVHPAFAAACDELRAREHNDR